MNKSLENPMATTLTARVRARWTNLLAATLLLLCQPLWAAPTDIIVLLDNSGSMRQNDPAFLLKSAVTKFFAELPADSRAGVVIFDQKVIYPVPLAAPDAAVQAAVKSSLAKVDYRGQYTNIPAAMERAIYELKTGGRKDAAKVVVFMTDGIVDTGNPAVDAEKSKWLREELATDAADSHIRIFGIAFTENADFFLIQSLAKKTSGEYFRALKPEDLDDVFAKVQAKLNAPVTEASPAAATAATETSPAEPAKTAAAAGAGASSAADCLAAMAADDRAAIEEMAKAASTTAEALCLEMKNTPPGQPVVTPAPTASSSATPAPTAAVAAAEPEAADSKMGVALIAGSALILLIAAGALMFILIKRRKSAPIEAPPSRATASGAVSSPPRVPEAFIKDINGITDEPATQITAKPMMIGRMAGTDQEHVDYFVVEKPTIGRRHALIRYRDFCFWIADQGSVNGTFLNGERIEGERQLKHGDRIRFHKYEFEFTMPEMDQAGHTIFSDPLNRTMVGDLDTMVGTAAIAGSAAVAAGAIARAAAAPQDHADDEDDDKLFDLTGGAASANSTDNDKTAFLSPPGAQSGSAHAEDLFGGDDTASDGDAEFVNLDDDDDFDEAGAETQLPVNLRSVILSGTHARAEAEFDAEASAFFDEDDLAVTSSPYSNTAIERGPVLRLDDDGTSEDEGEAEDTMQVPAAQFAPRAPAPHDDFSESETMLPVSPSVANQTQGVDISLDAFMNTDSFDTPLPGTADFDEDDATLLPHQVPDIDDVFDVTAEGTIPPVPRKHDDEDDDEHDRTTILG
jgi:hypothetical protein